ncbi:MAG: class I SAM-dependent DNA methyltransferase [Planctomycetia bacterium]|nr:class I SAM-dependent DNA methyltransferase [Planctomycetia bacterium]MCC7314099.1 class I SAM-dependent DNA methyltransferase [Planctomycetota bacterium]OQZ06917.1 MAG: SAM-dependent methyltransferase [Planctomycetes bacterium UTPLA1]
MPLSWNEIRNRAITFAQEWSGASRERAEAQTFWNEFFNIFGIRRRSVASFEEPVRNLGGAFDFIDLFWTGRLIAEHKSRGGDLSRAESQAMGYIQNLQNEGRGDEVPRYVIVSDFARIALHDLEPEEGQPATHEFPLSELRDNIRHFAFIAGYETRRIDPEDPANLRATELLANLHDRLEDGGYTGHDLQRFMVRILFCLFAEDTGIFEPAAFTNFILHRTREDGTDTGAQLSRLFDVLNRPVDERQTHLDEDLAALPYVNGELFAERLTFADFNQAMHVALVQCCRFKWEKISPAIFGSLFQNIMQARERRQIGAHYTSERDILKLIRSLFMDELRERFESAKRNRRQLEALHREIGEMRFLDPACGCGNFLVIAYRELRRLELDIIQARFGDQPTEADIRASARLHVGQFYGIEIEEWPVRIAEVAMWLMDHQMNAELFERFGQVKATTPLTRSPHIVQANALRIDWNEVLPAAECTYILGNPPFIGHHLQTESQKEDQHRVWHDIAAAGVLDFVTCWYRRAAEYMVGTSNRAAFVSTNSITQGEQPGIFWPDLFRRGIQIHFAHRTFQWMSEARGRAHVHVVIIGFGRKDIARKRIHEYEIGEDAAAAVIEVTNISPYLFEGPNAVLTNRAHPICNVPGMKYGNKPTDGGHFLMSTEDRDALLRDEPGARPFVRPYIGAEEFLDGRERWCLWLKDITPTQLRRLPAVAARVRAVKEFRLRSKAETTRKYAEYPTLFRQIAQPNTRFILIPRHTSESRQYIPFAYFEPDHIVSDSCFLIPNASIWHFGVISSLIHMAWVKQFCGRLESRYRYSKDIVYNNFPWPQNPTDAQKQKVEQAAQAVLDARAQFPDATLADLYDPNAMPAALRRAHDVLDRAVDRCYRPQPFTTERQRLEFLFALYEQLTAPLAAPAGRRRKKDRGG